MQNDSNKYLIVGLGNPGKSYERTRHNCGFLVLRALAKRWQVSFHLSPSVMGEVTEAVVEEKKVKLLMPQTYMNCSGLSVKRAQEKGGYSTDHILVIIDDVALPFGTLRLRKKGSSGGHKGLQSIEESLGTREYPRLRLGIGKPPEKELADYVLEEFSSEEEKKLPEVVQKACSIIEEWLE